MAHQVVQATLAISAYVHARPFPDRIQPLQHLHATDSSAPQACELGGTEARQMANRIMQAVQCCSTIEPKGKCRSHAMAAHSCINQRYDKKGKVSCLFAPTWICWAA